jgi:hypothetical protein
MVSFDNGLAISETGYWFVSGSERVDLSRRPSLRRILARLVDAHRAGSQRPITVAQLMESGWPGEIMIRESGCERVYTAIRTLRRMGLEGILVTRDGGYVLDPIPASRAA